MLETKRVTAYGKRSKRIVYVSDDRRAPHGSPLAVHGTSRENANSNSPPAIRKAFTLRGRKVRGLSTSPRGSPKSGNVLGIAAKKKAPLDATDPTPKRRPLHLKTTNPPDSPSIVYLGQKSTQTPNTKLISFAPFIDSDVIIIEDSERFGAARPTKPGNKGPIRSSQLKDTEGREEDVDLVRPPRRRALNRAVIVTDGEETEEEPTLKRKGRGAQASPIIVSSDESSDDYPVITPASPVLKLHALRSTKRPNLDPHEPRPPSKAPSRRIQAEVSVLRPLHPKPIGDQGFLLPPPTLKSILRTESVRPPSHRRSHRNVEPPTQTRARPPSPVPSDLERSLAGLGLSDVRPTRQPARPSERSIPQYLTPLLTECAQTEPHCFKTFIEAFPFDEIHGRHPSTGFAYRKIGEASYSEVFAIGNVVIKIIPLRDESTPAAADASLNLPQESDAKDVLQEMIVTRAMGQICPGFIRLLKTYVVLGGYPSLLLSLWDEHQDRKGTENIRPHIFPPTQTYALLVLPHGGPDLEAYTFPVKTGWRQACSIFWQIAKALAIAEELVSFEHRDLHWGQILVKSTVPIEKTVPRTPVRRRAGEDVPMDHPSHGVAATIIDLGLARMDAGDGGGSRVHWTPFDELIFEGEGDYQFDVYRMMQQYHGDSWDQYRPLTNVMWLHYLTTKLLTSKRLRPPGIRNATVATNGFNERQCYDCLVEVEQLLGSCVSLKKGKKGRGGGRKGTWSNAGDVVQFARERGWSE